MTMKFLRYGSVLDAFKALKPHNILPTIGALSKNMSLAVMLMQLGACWEGLFQIYLLELCF